MNIFKNSFKNLPKQIRTQYVAAIGALIKCTNKLDSEKIIKAIFLLSRCETEGQLEDGQLT